MFRETWVEIQEVHDCTQSTAGAGGRGRSARWVGSQVDSGDNQQDQLNVCDTLWSSGDGEIHSLVS